MTVVVVAAGMRGGTVADLLESHAVRLVTLLHFCT
jgi:hypothetical protein